jgi:hypothetical protein
MANTTIIVKGPHRPDTITVDTIPSLSFGVGLTHDMSQYINDPDSLRLTTTVNGLTSFATYNPSTELLTGIAAGTETGLTLEVTSN